jgi:hypothetical protein
LVPLGIEGDHLQENRLWDGADLILEDEYLQHFKERLLMVLLFEHLVVAVPHHLLLPALDAQLDYPAHPEQHDFLV